MSQILLFFEVMDKEPSLPFIWGFFLVLGIGGFFLTRKRPIFLLPILFLLCSCALPIISELNDPHVGPAIISEAGETYVTQGYFAIIAGILLPLCGLLAWFLKSEKK